MSGAPAKAVAKAPVPGPGRTPQVAPALRAGPAVAPAGGLHVAGNQAVQRFARGGTALARLTVSTPGDRDEREAEEVAARLMASDAPVQVGAAQALLHRQCAACAAAAAPRGDEEELTVHRQADSTAAAPRSAAGAPVPRRPGGGTPLPGPVRAFFEPRFGRDLGGVRLHTDASAAASARALAANAYTVGDDIVFDTGRYAPDTPTGRRLLAHELTHVVQHAGSPVLHREASAAAPERGGLLDTLTGGARAVGEAVQSGAGAVVRTVAGGAQAVAGAVTEGVADIGQMLGIPAPAEGSPQTVRTLAGVLGHPAVQGAMVLVPPPGAGPMLRLQVATLAASLDFLDFAWRTYRNPGPLLAEIRAALAPRMAEVGPLAMGTAAAGLGADVADREGALDCIWRHLRPKLDYIAENWWEVLLAMGRDLLWPWPGVAADFGQLWDQLKLAGRALWEWRLSDAVDHVLAVLRHLNAAAGRLYGWFLVISVLVGAVVGGVAGTALGGPAGAPGAAAGAAGGLQFAAEVGLWMLIATLAVEGASILKSAYNLTREDRSAAQRECDCEIIAGSSITVAITGALALLGALAARFAKMIAQRLANRMFEPPQTVQRSTRRGRVIEGRVTLGELIKARLNLRRIVITDRLTPSGLLGERGNFVGIDLAMDAQVTVRSGGNVLRDANALRSAMANNQPITVDVNGGTIVSVRSRAGTSAFRSLQSDIRQLAGTTGGTSPSMTAGIGSTVTSTLTNPASRVLVAVCEPGRLTAAQIARLEALAVQRNVVLRLSEGVPPPPILVTAIDSMPAILAELAAEGLQVAEEQQQAQSGTACTGP